MQGETRKLVALTASPSDVLKRSAGPVDNTFFLSARVLATSKKLRNPYQQHPYFHAAVKRAASSLSSVPFVIFKEAGAGDRVAGENFKTRSEAFQVLRSRFPILQKEIFDIFHDRGEEVRKALRRDFVRTIQRLAPQAPIGLIARAVGIEAIDSGPWYDLFLNVNPEMTRSQLWEATTIFLNNDGECFWVLLDKSGRAWKPPDKPSNDLNNIPAEIWPFGKVGWKEVIGEKTKIVEKWKFQDPRQKGSAGREGTLFDANQIMHYRFFDPVDLHRGLAPFDALFIELKQDHNAARYNDAFFERGAQLSGMMMFDRGLSTPQREEVEDQFMRDHVGIDNMWKPAIFEGGGKWQATGVSQRDMQFFTLRQWVRDEVLAVVGTPKSELGIFQDVNRASAVVSKRVFWENTNLPLIHYFEDLADSQLFTPVTGGAIWGAFDVSGVQALREDLTDKLEAAEKLWRMGFTANEINERLMLGFEDAPWRDVGWVNQNLLPVFDDPRKEEEPPEEEPPEDGDEPSGPGMEPGSPGEEPEDDDEPVDDDDQAGRPGFHGTRELVPVPRGPYTRERAEELNQIIIERVMFPGEEKLRKVIRSLMWRIRSAQLALIGDAEEIISAEAIVFKAAKFKDQLTKDVQPILMDVFQTAADQAEAELVEIGHVQPAMFRQIDATVDPDAGLLVLTQAQMIQRIVDTVRGTLVSGMDKAIAGGLTQPQMKKVIRDKFRFLGGSYAVGRTAQSEAARTNSHARDLIFRRRKVPSEVWLSSLDDRVRDEHALLDDGKPREIGFNWGSLIGPGIILEYPLDPRAPAKLTIACRCTLLPHTAKPGKGAVISGAPRLGGPVPMVAPRVPTTFDGMADAHIKGIEVSNAARLKAGKMTQAEIDEFLKAADIKKARRSWKAYYKKHNQLPNPTYAKMVNEAMEENYGDANWQKVIAKWGDDHVTMYKHASGSTKAFGTSAAAQRVGGTSMVMESRLSFETQFKLKSVVPKPGSFTVSNGSLPTTLRHEYGHMVDDALRGTVNGEHFRELVKKVGISGATGVEGQISKYSITNMGEAFAEVFALATDPRYNPNNFTDEVNELVKWMQEIAYGAGGQI